MSYHAKKPRKKRLRISLTKCWYVAVVDEEDNELLNDWYFGTREDAMRYGQKLMDEVKSEEAM